MNKCVCGHKFSEHNKIEVEDEGIIYVCPNNQSGLCPSVYKENKGLSDE